MDVALSIVTGLGLRLFLTGINDSLAPVLIGIWEGAFVNQLSNQSSGGSPAVDHYLAYGLRLVVDVLFTGNPRRMVLILLWTTLGMVASEVVTVNLIQGEEKRERRRRHSRSLPSHVRAYEAHINVTPDLQSLPPPQPQIVTNTPPFLTQQINTEQQPEPQIQHVPVSRPPSPPSFFLHDNTEIYTPSPKPVQLQFQPSQSSPLQRPRSGLASFFEESGSPLPKHVLPPTPPESAVPETSAVQDSEPRRLTPIQELSVEDLTNPSGSRSPESSPLVHHIAQPASRYNDQYESSYAPSATTSAIPIPIPRVPALKQTIDDPNDGPVIYALSTPTTAPLPVLISRSNFSTWIDNTSEPDELRTPGQPNWDLAADTDHDELLTPVALRPTELSPLMLDEELISEPEPQPFMIPIPISMLEPTPIPIDEEPPPTSFTDFAILQPPEPSSSLLRSPALLPIPPTKTSRPDPALFSPVSEAESIVSPGLAARLFSRAEALRQQARNEEEVRARLKNEHDQALREQRIKEALFLRGKIEESEERVFKLHRRAERRFIIGSPHNFDPHAVF